MEEVSVLIGKSQSGDKEAREVLNDREKSGTGASHCEKISGQRL